MKITLVQMNVGNKMRFMPQSESGLRNYPRDGWITESAARKWAAKNSHDIVKVEKIAGKGEKIFKITYTFQGFRGEKKTNTVELVGKNENEVKQRVIDGLKRNGDKFISWGKVMTKDSVDAIREKYLGDSTEESTIDSIREKYQADAPSKAEIAKYYRFLVVAEGMDGKMIRPSGGSYYRKYEDALRAAKSLEKPTTHHLFIEGEYADAPSMNHKALYTWRNPKAK